MVIKTTSILAAAAVSGGMAGTTSLVMDIVNIGSSYVPFLIGGISLYVWLVKNDEAEFSLMESIYVIVPAILIGWLFKGATEYIGEIAFQGIRSAIPVAWMENSEKLRSGSIVSDVSTAVGFGLGVFSKMIINRVFSKREVIADKLEDKLGGSK